MDKGHHNLEIYKIAHRMAIQVHKITLGLPPHERYEEGSQVRRSAKSVAANIVEGYALRRYKNDFVRYLFRAYASGQETIEHIELLHDSGSLSDQVLYQELHQAYNHLVGKILRYIQAVDKEFDMPYFIKEPGVEYETARSPESYEL